MKALIVDDHGLIRVYLKHYLEEHFPDYQTHVLTSISAGLPDEIIAINPELVILGGTISRTGDYIKLPARTALNKFSLSLVNSDTQFKVTKLAEKAGVMGGCLIARNKILS